MTSLNSIGLGLSLTFGFLLLALVGEMYYLLWWKRSWHRGGATTEDDFCSSTSSSSAREFMYMFCCKKQASDSQPLSTTVSLTDRFQQQSENSSSSSSSTKDLLLKSGGVGSDEEGLMGFDDTDMTAGPPGILFTIMEETREDLESEDGGVSERSLSDLMVRSVEIDETPYLTPLSSPSMFITPPLTPISSYTHLGFNPLFESSSDIADLRIWKAPSPPPKFKFLQEAEDKFQRRRMMEASDEDHFNNGSDEDGEPESCEKVEREESFMTIIVASGSRGQRG